MGNFSEAYIEYDPFLGFICSTLVGTPEPIVIHIQCIYFCIVTKAENILRK